VAALSGRAAPPRKRRQAKPGQHMSEDRPKAAGTPAIFVP
jgi:hypothetical protein